MESQKWRRIEEIFEAAVEKPPALRAAFLDARCEGDATVRAEVESLLRADDQSGDFLAGIFDGAGERAGVIAKDAVIGPYRIVERIAEGGMGVVYKAFDTRLERDVALKFLANSTGLSDPGHQRFLLEAKAASSLDHPSICTIHDIGQTGDGHTYIVMPYYVGRTLEHLLRDGPLPLSSAVWFALQVADGLSKAHHQGIWHRDLKPANLIVSPDERLTILDFGIAKMRGMELTSAGVRLGTLAYMAPEQLRAEDVDQRADIWALGSILFEMLVGRRVFVADRDHRLMYAILEEPIPSLSQHLTDCPPELNALVAKAVQRDREDRFGSMHEMHEVLVRCYNELGRGAAVPIPIARPVASPAVVAPREQENVSVSSLMSWLVELGLERYAAVFEAAEVDEETIVELEESDLIDLGIPVGPRKKLLRAMPELVTWNAERNSQMETQLALTRAGSDTAGRRQITVMFCDLVESTALSRVLDPEDLRDLLDAYERAGMAVIERYDGHVAQRLGDGLLVYFGYPRAHEDDPERAVSAGLDIIRSVRALDVRPDLELRTRVGIATGEVVISRSDGSTGAPETAVGEAPNLASRLLDIASPDTVVIAQNTRDRVAELFEYADLGAHELRGYAEPVRAWHVTGARAEYDRFTALRGVRASTPTVGREDEFELLRRRWSQAKAGNGQVVILSGQPGIGKSKLVGTLRDSVADDQTVLLRYYGSPYHANTVLHPVAEQIAAVSGLRAEDRPGEKLDKVEQLLGRMGIDMPEAGSLLASLLNIEPGERYARVERSPARQRALTLDMLEAQLATLSARQPVLFIFEDLHWVDATSIDLLTQLIEHLREQRVMMLLTCRPEFTPPWLDEAHVSLAPCKRLTQEESYALLEEIAGEEKLPSELMKQVVDRADGVPLFLEELTAAVLGSDLPSESTTSTLTSGAYARVVPASLQDSLMAQLDRLGPARGLAQVGACIGRQFSFELLRDVTQIENLPLTDGLEELTAAGIIQRRGTPPDATYSFKHALIQDAAYGSLLRSRRKELHTRTASMIEEHYPERTRNEPEILAYHWTEADDVPNAVKYWHRASRIAIQKSAYVESIRHLDRGLQLLEGTPADEARWARELELLADLGPARIATQGYASPEVERIYAQALELCGKVGDVSQRVRALLGQGIYHTLRADYSKGWEVSEQALALSTQAGNSVFEVDSRIALGTNALFFGRFEQAYEYYTGAYSQWKQTDRQTIEKAFKFATDAGVVSLSYGARALWFLGFPDRALALAQQGLELARDLDHSLSIAQAWCLLANIHQVRGEVAQTLDVAEQVIEYSNERGYPYWSALAAIIHGWAMANHDDPASGATKIRTYLDAYTGTGARLGRSWFLALLADAERKRGNVAGALEAVAQGLEVVEQTGEAYYAAELHRLHGELLDVSSPGAGTSALVRSLELARGQRAKSLELKSALVIAQGHHAAERPGEAHAILAPVLASLPEDGESRDVQIARELLASA